MRGTFLWRHRVVLTSGILLLFALHMLSAGLAPGARAEKPSLALLWLLKPVQAIEANIADDSSGFFHDYFDLVNVRRENVRLKEQVADLEGQRTRLAELEAETTTWAICWSFARSSTCKPSRLVSSAPTRPKFRAR